MRNNFVLTGLLTLFLSGALFYFSTGFHTDWILLWFAPILVLVYSYYQNNIPAFCVAFGAFLIGKLNMLSYLGSGIPTINTLIPIFMESVVFGVIIIINRYYIKKIHHWFILFLFPALWTSYEFLLSLVSSGGSFLSLAYNQISFLSFIQIVSLTGIWGASFVLLLFSSGISYAIYTKNRLYKWIGVTIAIVIPLSVIIYGEARLHHTLKNTETISIGLISINTPRLIYDKDALSISKQYMPLIQQAAKQGARYVVLPEKFINVHQNNYKQIIPLFQQAAQDNHVTLIIGVGILANKNFNSAVIIDDSGKIIDVYNKHHLLSGLEDHFTAGTVYFNHQDAINWGVAICKDMDFSSLGQHYGETHTQLLFVPALDFSFDAWYHGRSAIMRGIENGFAVARSSGSGYLSITNQMGKIVALYPDYLHNNSIIVGNVAVYPLHTLYAQWGNWFPCFILLCLFVFMIRPK
ncbi:MAG: nitrilase-related carbon-nitrogen hydrolase [Pseudomonadota bacterium]